jgi:PhzF family phenazine biosynthesis protein
MELDIFQIDAFTDSVFCGNPAAVVPLDNWLDTSVLQNIAAENNVSETAFIVREGEAYEIRWFTPTVEVPLCGHATLASSYVLFKFLDTQANALRFQCELGELHVTRTPDALQMRFPRFDPLECEKPSGLESALGCAVSAVYKTDEDPNLYALVESEALLASLTPNFEKLQALFAKQGVVVTAKGDAGHTRPVDFVSRYFAPAFGIPEDPVTGSIHCGLVPMWAAKLGKQTLKARQVSARVGHLNCELRENEVVISGQAQLYLRGKIYI